VAGAPVPELRRLRYFLAVARTRNFTRAAAQLHVAQPALSRQVRQLEEELGVELLRRTTHEVELTAAGRHLLDEGPALLAAADELWRAARAFGAGARGAVVLGYGASAGYETVPLLLRALGERVPGLQVTTRLLSLGEILDGLRGGTLDVGVARCPPRSPDLTARVLRDERQGALLRRDDDRAGGATFALTALGQTALLLHPREANPGHYDAVLGLLRERGVEPRVRHRSVTLDLAQTPIVAGEAIAIVGESSRSGVPDELVWLPLEPPATLEVQLLTRRAGLTPATDALVAAAEAVADELGWRATARGDAVAG
jgi:DNA-binding transcriptional LysR family regulator